MPIGLQKFHRLKKVENKKLRLLIIDDDKDILGLAEKLLQKDYDVLTASSALHGLEILNSVKCDGLISDINMPEMNGFQLLNKIKKNKNLQELTIAMLTGVRERKDIEKAILLGVSDYIVKPIDPMLFLTKVDTLFKDKVSGRNEVNFVKVKTTKQAFIKNKIEILSVSEMGLMLSCSIEHKQGQIIELDFELFDELNIRAPHLKVLSCKKNSPKEWILYVGFVGASEAIRQKLRAWIYKQSTQKRAVA